MTRCPYKARFWPTIWANRANTVLQYIGMGLAGLIYLTAAVTICCGLWRVFCRARKAEAETETEPDHSA